MQDAWRSLHTAVRYTKRWGLDGRSDTMVDTFPNRSLLMHILDLLVEWQMRQSLRAISRGQRD